MVDQVMRGATNVRMGIAQYLKSSLPAMRQRALNTWSNAKPGEVPPIKVFNPFDNIELGSGSDPVLGVDCYRSTDWSASDVFEDSGKEYRARYQVRLNLWMWSQQDEVGDSVTPQRAGVIRQRDDLTALVRACLLDRPTLGTGDALLLNEKTLTEDYHTPSPAPNNSKRWFAGSQISFDVQADELLLATVLNDPSRPNAFDIEVEVRNLDAEGHYPNIGKLP